MIRWPTNIQRGTFKGDSHQTKGTLKGDSHQTKKWDVLFVLTFSGRPRWRSGPNSGIDSIFTVHCSMPNDRLCFTQWYNAASSAAVGG